MKTKTFTFIIAGVMAFTMLSIPGMSAFAQSLPTGGSFGGAPQNLTVELKEWEDGRPYLRLSGLTLKAYGNWDDTASNMESGGVRSIRLI